jgi:hypothetical protein
VFGLTDTVHCVNQNEQYAFRRGRAILLAGPLSAGPSRLERRLRPRMTHIPNRNSDALHWGIHRMGTMPGSHLARRGFRNRNRRKSSPAFSDIGLWNRHGLASCHGDLEGLERSGTDRPDRVSAGLQCLLPGTATARHLYFSAVNLPTVIPRPFEVQRAGHSVGTGDRLRFDCNLKG